VSDPYDVEEHIDNPRDYADNLDARQYDPRLRAPCNEQNEISVDWGNAMKLYIASEGRGIDTSGQSTIFDKNTRIDSL